MKSLTIIVLLIIGMNAQVQKNQTNSTANAVSLQENQAIENYTKDSLIGCMILAAIFGLAYISGRTGHRFIQNQIDSQLTQIRQTEDENQTSDEKEIANQIQKLKNHEIDTAIDSNELHLPQEIKITPWRRMLFKVNGWLNQWQRMRRQRTDDKIELKQREMYNQFEFEDSI